MWTWWRLASDFSLLKAAHLHIMWSNLNKIQQYNWSFKVHVNVLRDSIAFWQWVISVLFFQQDAEKGNLPLPHSLLSITPLFICLLIHFATLDIRIWSGLHPHFSFPKPGTKVPHKHATLKGPLSQVERLGDEWEEWDRDWWEIVNEFQDGNVLCAPLWLRWSERLGLSRELNLQDGSTVLCTFSFSIVFSHPPLSLLHLTTSRLFSFPLHVLYFLLSYLLFYFFFHCCFFLFSSFHPFLLFSWPSIPFLVLFCLTFQLLISIPHHGTTTQLSTLSVSLSLCFSVSLCLLPSL